jgi:tetratricopeptide (TPR) repeat protein
MSKEFLDAIDVRPIFYTEVKKLTLPKPLRQGGRIVLIWTLVTFGLLVYNWPLGAFSAAGQALWSLWLTRSKMGVARKNFLLGNHAAYAGKYREALDLFNNSLSLYPDMQEISLIMGDIHFKKGEQQSGVEAYKRYLEKYPQDNVAKVKLLLILMREGLYREQLALMESLPDELTQDYLLSILKAFALLQVQKPDQAEKVLRDIPPSELEGEGKNVPLNYLLGKVYVARNEPYKAKKHFKNVLQDREDFLDTAALLRKSS